MKTLFRSILMPIAVLALAAVLAWLFIQREQRQFTQGRANLKADGLEMRRGAIEAAKKAHQVMLETERIAYERGKQEEEMRELAELGHEVRMLRIDLEYKTILAGIDKQFPPPNPPAAAPVEPEKPPATP